MVVVRKVSLFLRLWFIVEVKENLRRLSARSAVEGHAESCITIYTLLLLMEYAVKAMSWVSLRAGQGGQFHQKQKDGAPRILHMMENT